MTTHRLELAYPGLITGARVVCDGDDTSLCRQWCTEGCEEGCWHDPIPADTELIAQAPADGHRWAPIGYCRIASWLNAVGLDNTYADDDGHYPPHLPELRSGVLDVEWNGDDYLWRYDPAWPDDTAPAPVPVHPDQLELLPAP